jgi:hypothetical protein
MWHALQCCHPPMLLISHMKMHTARILWAAFLARLVPRPAIGALSTPAHRPAARFGPDSLPNRGSALHRTATIYA